MIIWIVWYIPQVGDQDIDSVWSSEELAKRHIKSKPHPGQWDMCSMRLDGEAK